jgi:excisionase family DNA binding protein
MAKEARPGSLLTIKDVVAFTRCSDSTVRRAVRNGQLTAFSMPGGLRFRQEDVDGWVQAHAIHADVSQPVGRRPKLSDQLAVGA